jgi:nucleotide-binding universal stress UspA family protein
MYKRILIPLDGIASSEAILPHVKTMAQATQSEMILLYVIPAPAPEFAPFPKPLGRDPNSKRRSKMTRYLKTVCANLENEGAAATYLIREGGVADTILEVADLMQADLIAMSTRGRPAAQILLLGNLTYQVVRHSPLPMLIVRSRRMEKRGGRSRPASSRG